LSSASAPPPPRARPPPSRPRLDFAFLDAVKLGYPAYYDLIVPRLLPGGLLLLDTSGALLPSLSKRMPPCSGVGRSLRTRTGCRAAPLAGCCLIQSAIATAPAPSTARALLELAPARSPLSPSP
jgi:hypothetical protein